MSLTNQEKIEIINQHIKNSEKNEFNLYVSLLGEQQKSDNDLIISALEKQIQDEVNKQTVLNSEKTKLQA
jgi:hypothetical protein